MFETTLRHAWISWICSEQSHSTFLLLMGREARGKGHSTSASRCISVFVLLLAKAGTNGTQTGVDEVGDVLPTPTPSSTTLSWGCHS